jgi:hypothetical protein
MHACGVGYLCRRESNQTTSCHSTCIIDSLEQHINTCISPEPHLHQSTNNDTAKMGQYFEEIPEASTTPIADPHLSTPSLTHHSPS